MNPEPDDLLRLRDCSNFAHSARHELLTPLSGLTMLLAAARDGGAHDNLARLLDQALTATERATRIVRACVEFVDADLPVSTMVAVDSGLVCAEAQAGLRASEPRFERAVVEVMAPLPTVHGDTGLLRRVFVSLLDNAVRYTREVPARVLVSAVPQGEAWRFEIADRGIGLSAEQRARVCGAFERLHAWDSIPGVGLSLATSRRVVVRHGGELGLRARDGGGTIAWFTLPRG